jgi:mannose/fructose/N-acetylgalactosamine-specific phosphotransferase system component IIC
VIENWVWLLLWGTVVGLDLVSVGQVMFARPLVAGTVAGMIVGDPIAGGTVGVVLELFALDVLPVGAVRYPDYGIGAVAAAATAAGAPGALGTGVAVCVGLGVAYLGEVGIRVVRSRNTEDMRRNRAALEEGDESVVIGTHLRSLLRDAVRSVAVTAAGLLLAVAAYRWSPVSARGAVLVTIVLVGAAIGAAAGGGMRLGGRGLALRWFGLGVAAGVVLVVML